MDAADILPFLMTPLLARLNDANDDVKGTAASALLPVAKFMGLSMHREASTYQYII